MTPIAIRRTVNQAWAALERHLERLGSKGLTHLQEAELRAREGEKAHRRVCGGNDRYRVSVETAARLVVLQKVFEGAPPPKSWADAASIRPDCLLAYAVREYSGYQADAFPCLDFTTIDYAKDIAK